MTYLIQNSLEQITHSIPDSIYWIYLQLTQEPTHSIFHLLKSLLT